MNFTQHQLQMDECGVSFAGIYLLLPFGAESVFRENCLGILLRIAQNPSKSCKIEQNRGGRTPERDVESGVLNADHQESCTVCGAQTYPNLSSNARTANYLRFFLHEIERFRTEANFSGHTRITEITISRDPVEIQPPAWDSGISSIPV